MGIGRDLQPIRPGAEQKTRIDQQPAGEKQQQRSARAASQGAPHQLREALPRVERPTETAQQSGIEQPQGQSRQRAQPGGAAAQGGGGARDQPQYRREQGCADKEIQLPLASFHEPVLLS